MTCPAPFVAYEEGCRFTVPLTVVDEHGHPVENDYEGRNGCPHGKEPKMKSEATLEQGVPTMGHPEPVIPDVSALIPKDSPVSGLTVVLVGMVLASGLALKLFPTWLDHKTKRAQADARKPDCASRHTAVEEQVRTVAERAIIHEARIAALEQKEENHDP